MDNKSILEDQLASFKAKYPLTVGWRLRNNSRIVLQHFHNDEVIKYAFYAQKNNNPLDFTSTAIIAVTNKRLVIGRDRVVIGYFFDSITPDMFNDLKVKSGIIWGKIEIDTVKEFVVLSNISKSALVEIEREVGSAMLEMRDTIQVERKNNKSV